MLINLALVVHCLRNGLSPLWLLAVGSGFSHEFAVVHICAYGAPISPLRWCLLCYAATVRAALRTMWSMLPILDEAIAKENATWGRVGALLIPNEPWPKNVFVWADTMMPVEFLLKAPSGPVGPK